VNDVNGDVEKGEVPLTAGELLPAQAMALAEAEVAAAEEAARGRGTPMSDNGLSIKG
jgi:hypothetical protein